MRKLVEAEQVPVTLIALRQFITLVQLLLAPVDVIVNDKFTYDNGQCQYECCGRQNQEYRQGQYRVQRAMKNPAGMPVNTLVFKLIGRLKDLIPNRVFRRQHDEGQQD